MNAKQCEFPLAYVDFLCLSFCFPSISLRTSLQDPSPYLSIARSTFLKGDRLPASDGRSQRESCRNQRGNVSCWRAAAPEPVFQLPLFGLCVNATRVEWTRVQWTSSASVIMCAVRFVGSLKASLSSARPRLCSLTLAIQSCLSSRADQDTIAHKYTYK